MEMRDGVMEERGEVAAVECRLDSGGEQTCSCLLAVTFEDSHGLCPIVPGRSTYTTFSDVCNK
jgi:hypothetical protein